MKHLYVRPMRTLAGVAYLLGVLCLGVGLALPVGARPSYAESPSANTQDCVFAFKEEKNADPTSSYDAPSGYQVCTVIVKAGSEQSGGGKLTFGSDGCQAFVPGNDYCVIGIGTGSATATRTCEESRDCHAISYASYWIKPVYPTETPTSTPTNTPTDTPTNTPTYTPTETPTNTPTATPSDTPTNTPTDTPTSTPTNTPTNTPTDLPLPPGVTPTDPPTSTPTDPPTPTATDPPTATPTDIPPEPGPSSTPTDPPTATPPAASPASTQVPPPAPTSAVPIPQPVPVTGGVQSPVLIPVTGVELAGQGHPASRLFQNLGLAFLGLGLGIHGLSLRRPQEE